MGIEMTPSDLIHKLIVAVIDDEFKKNYPPYYDGKDLQKINDLKLKIDEFFNGGSNGK